MESLTGRARNLLRSVGIRSLKRPWDGRVIALHDCQTMCFLIPKVACSSLTAVCVDLLGFELPDGSWKPSVFRGDRYDHLVDIRKRDAAKLSRSDVTKFPNYWRFTFVRNPLDRLVSCYSEKIRDSKSFVDGVHPCLLRFGVFHRDMSFHDFARAVADIPDENADGHFRSQWTFIADGEGNLEIDFIGHFERLEEDMQKVANHLRFSFTMPHLLKSDRRSYKEYYDDALLDTIARRYQNDFHLFGYDIKQIALR